jgi:hypothetical protein
MNGWLASNGHHLTAVYAGSSAAKTGVGRFLIIRQNLDIGSQTQSVVDVPRTGPIHIVHAPEGKGAEASGQRATLEGITETGARVLLDLRTDKASVED